MQRNGGIRSHLRISPEQLAKGLGWFSLGLGLIQILAPRTLGRLCGFRANPNLMRVLGLREAVSGIGILLQRRPAGWMQARVAGDAMDLALLSGTMLTSANPTRVSLTSAAVASVAALDVVCSKELRRNAGVQRSDTAFHKIITINRSPDELYNFWRNFEALPRFMSHLESVKVTDPTHSHWVAKGPAGTRLEWDAEITGDIPNKLISWRSLPHADVDHSGSVTFEPARGNRGTVLRVEMIYRPLAGAVGAKVAKLFGQSPEKQVQMDLLHLKQLLETGEVATTEGQPAGRSRSTSLKFDEPTRA